MILQPANLTNDLTRTLVTMPPEELEELAMDLVALATEIRFGGRDTSPPARASLIANYLVSRMGE